MSANPPSDEERPSTTGDPPVKLAEEKQKIDGILHVHAWVSSIYNLVVDVPKGFKVVDLYRHIENSFAESFNIDFKVLALQDPNHNDLPSTCPAKLVLKNSDKVFIVIHPDSFKSQPAKKRVRTNDDEGPKKKSISKCFSSYFKLRETLDRPQSVKSLIRKSEKFQNSEENRIILNRIRMISQELQNKKHPGEASAISTSASTSSSEMTKKDDLSQIVNRLPHESQIILCSVGRSIVQEMLSPLR